MSLTERRADQMKEIISIPPVSTNLAEAAPKTQRYQSGLKYYIHDSIDVLRLELTGELNEKDVTELNGCWRTAKTTLGSRRLLLDLRRLAAIDEGGRQWLFAMSGQESASFLPECPPHLLPAGKVDLRAACREVGSKRCSLEKLFGCFRGARVSVVKSSTPAP